MKISLVQMAISEDKLGNCEKAMRFAEECAARGADVICFPEKFLCKAKDGETAESLDSPIIDKFKTFAKQKNVNIILGSIGVKSDNPNKTCNTCLVINRGGEIVHRYDKKYAFVANVNNINVDESAYTVLGDKIGFFELDGIKMGVGICFDLRYPEYFRELVKLGAEIIFLPSSFYKGTGEYAWDVLTRARAIENQVYFCGCNHCGGIAPAERCGNTRIVSYTGEIMQNLAEGEGVVTATVDLNALRRFRKDFPVLRRIRA